MTCVGWISFEVSAFVLGTIDETQLGINSVLVNIISILAMVSIIKTCSLVHIANIGSCWAVNISDNKSRE